jgi:hypothetical protein
MDGRQYVAWPLERLCEDRVTTGRVSNAGMSHKKKPA